MDYDELIYTLYRFARETEDEELQGWLLDVGFVVKKNGIRGLVDDPNIDPDDDIHFEELISRLKTMTDIANDEADRVKLKWLQDALVSNGIDGYIWKNHM